MKITALAASIVAVAAAFVAPSSAAPPSMSSASCSGAISWQQAGRMVGRVATVRGPVAGATFASSSNGSPTFLNVGADYPNSRRFTVVIWIQNRARFGRPERRYAGRTICVRGLVESYRGVAEIEATSPSQIAIAR